MKFKSFKQFFIEVQWTVKFQCEVLEIFTMSEKKLLLLDSFLKPATSLSVKIVSKMVP